MFTVKLYKHRFVKEQDGKRRNVESHISLSCPMYEVYPQEDGKVVITIYKNHSKWEPGVDYRLSHKDDDPDNGIYYQHSCYVENSAGKTIEAVVPTDDR